MTPETTALSSSGTKNEQLSSSAAGGADSFAALFEACLLYTSPFFAKITRLDAGFEEGGE